MLSEYDSFGSDHRLMTELAPDLAGYIDHDLKALVTDFDSESSPTRVFQRVVHRDAP